MQAIAGIMQELTLSEVIARHIASTMAADLPSQAMDASRRALLDASGVMLAATTLSPDARPYREVAKFSRGPCRVLGSEHGAGPGHAASANGALAHALDFGDCFDAGPAHPHAALVPALLALSDLRPETELRQFLAALAVGGDLACRLSLAPRQPYEVGGWYPPPLVNLIAGAAACCAFLGLGEKEIIHAMGLALLSGSFPSLLKYDRNSPLRGMREAVAARGAVEAALLAEAGAIGFGDPLGDKGGFFEVYAGGCRTEILLDRLGEVFLGTQVSFKPWPACRGTHAYIEAALRLRDAAAPANIQTIEAGVGPIQEMLSVPLPPWPEPVSPTQAKFSIPYAVAVALLEGEVTLDSFDASHLSDRRIRLLADKVSTAPVRGWGREHAASGQLAILLGDGSRQGLEILEALGSPARPLSDASLVEKFVACAGRADHALKPSAAGQIANSILAAPSDLPIGSLLDRLGHRPTGLRSGNDLTTKSSESPL